jgi:hypothetical protein
MSVFLISPATRNCLYLTPRTASHSLALAVLHAWHPDAPPAEGHPSQSLPPIWEWPDCPVALIVRNPIERFRSMVAHRPERTLEEHLAQPFYGPLPTGKFAKYFRFEDQLNEAAVWLGLPTPLPHEDATDPEAKPNLTPEQETHVRKLFTDDIVLWDSLQ